MMTLSYLKRKNINLPIPIGQLLSYIPFEFRPFLGNAYKQKKKEIINYELLTAEMKKEFIFKKFFQVFEHAYLNIPFYSNLYKSHGIELGDIQNFNSIELLPIITKEDLLDVTIEERSFNIKGRILVNTGGSSGNTLSFYMDPARFGNEWAHIHTMWSSLNYNPSSLKISFDGRSNVKDLIQYDFLRHSLRFDIYADKKKVCDKLLNYSQRYPIKFLHGYPSAIYDFAIFCKENNEPLRQELSKTLKGVFLSSEYPIPIYRNTIEEIFGIQTQSFYGHTETCVMAFEKEEKYKYNVFQTYGFAETVTNEIGKTFLVGTSYTNFASPLIRYNTEDSIIPFNIEEGLLDSFKIENGRIGDFVISKEGQRIPLTGLIFGRHHKIFDYCKHLQVRQDYPGRCTILYVSDYSSKQLENMENLFDLTNVDIEFSFEKIEKPILTKSGKINLLVK